MSRYRVREIISHIDYGNCVYTRVISDLNIFFKDVPTRKYPGFVYNIMKYSPLLKTSTLMMIGVFMDGLVRIMIARIRETNISSRESDIPVEFYNKGWRDVYVSYFMYILRAYHSPTTIEETYIRESLKGWGGFLERLYIKLEKWFSVRHSGDVMFNTEWNFESVSGHPDIILTNSAKNLVLDIKTTQSFQNMSESTFKQILSYVTLLNINNTPITHVGVLFPLQLLLVRINVTKWDSSGWLFEMMRASSVCDTYISIGARNSPEYIIQSHDSLRRELGNLNVGRTVGKETILRYGNSSSKGTWLDAFKILSRSSDLKRYPIQIMLTGRINTRVNLTDLEIAEISELITENTLKMYVHAAYSINLARGWTNANSDDKMFGIDATMRVLQASAALSAKGVVIHTGKFINIPRSVGIKKLIKNIRFCLQFASEECPLLLETPVGVGTELGDTFEEFSGIYGEFTLDERKRFKICCDLCHVFVAKYNPLLYIKKWISIHGPQSIGLIHFNDAKRECGCHRDGHALYGQGNIGKSILREIAMLCNNYSIDMVTE